MFPHFDVDPKSVYLVGLDERVTVHMLSNYFTAFGQILKIYWNPRSQETLAGQKWAIITFNDEVSARIVLSEARHIFENCVITAQVCRHRLR